MNKVIQVITFVADPEVKTYGSEGKSVASFRGAVNKRFKKEGEPDADFFKYTAFGKTADFIGKYFKKGQKALIVGELNNNNYEKDGVKHYTDQILVESVEFFGKKSDSEVDASTSTSSSTSKASTPSKTTSAKVESYDEFDDF